MSHEPLGESPQNLVDILIQTTNNLSRLTCSTGCPKKTEPT